MMCSHPKITVCIPVYNVAGSLVRCLDSVLGQTLQDIEIIAVDDCSPDASASILREYASRDGRLRVLTHTQNLGLARARKTAYVEARGEYVTFFDSDDTLPHDALERLYEKAVETGADVVCGGCNMTEPDGKVSSVKLSYLRYGTDSSSVLNAMLHRECTHNMCSKLFRRELLTDHAYVTYDHCNMGEDAILCYQVMPHCRKVVALEEPVYDYWVNSASETHTRMNEKSVRSVLRLLQLLREQVLVGYPELARIRERYIAFTVVQLYVQGYNWDMDILGMLREHGLEEYSRVLPRRKQYSLIDCCKLLIKRYPMCWAARLDVFKTAGF